LLLLLMLLNRQAEVDAAVAAMGKPTPEDLKQAREQLGISTFEAACIAGLSKAQNWEVSEHGASAMMDGHRWTMFRLRAGIHPTHRMIEKATGIEPVITTRTRAEQLVYKKPRPTPGEIFGLRSGAGKTQQQMCKFAGLRFQTTWAAYESGKTKMDPERWELLQLMLGQHPTCELKLREFKTGDINERSQPFPIDNQHSGQRLGDHVPEPDAAERQRLRQPLPNSSSGPGHRDDHDGARTVLQKREAITLIKETLSESGLSLKKLQQILDGTMLPEDELCLTAAQREAVKLIRETMDDEEILPKNLLPRGGPRDRDPLGFRSYPYMDKASGKGWSGRGTEPQWLKVEIYPYLDKSSGKSWSGEGLTPLWLEEAIKNGKSLQDFANKNGKSLQDFAVKNTR